MKAWRTAAWCGLGLVVLLLAALAWCQRALNEPYAGWAEEAVEVRIEPGLSAGEIFERLEQLGVLKDQRLLRAWLRFSGQSARLQAGEYRFDAPLSAIEVLRRLQEGDVKLYPVTLPEGLTRAEIATRIAAAGFGSAEELLALFDDPGLVLDLDPQARNLEGYLFPDTYFFANSATPQSITAALVRRFRQAADSHWVARAAAHGLDIREAVTLASMIEKETSLASERERISSVFHNRLVKRMRLQCDPTVIYAIREAGGRVETLTTEDLEFESPWNTYKVYGLPPGPIGSPGKASLEAAVEPAAGKDLYFVASPDGGHSFSSDLESHLKAVAEWRRYWRSSR